MKGLYPQASGEIAIIFLQDGDDYDAVCKRVTPYNTPYLIVSDSGLPSDWSTSAAWEADFSNPHGVGMGSQRWFIAQAQAAIANGEPEAPHQAIIDQMKAEVFALEGVHL